MKIFIQILGQQKQEGKGAEEAIENRSYLAKRMTEEVTQITRILEDSGVGKDQVHLYFPLILNYFLSIYH